MNHEMHLAAFGGMLGVLSALLVPQMLPRTGQRATLVRIRAGIAAAPPAHGSAVLLLLVTAGIHLMLVPAHLEENPVIGWLFVAAVLSLITTAAASYLVPWWRVAATLLLLAMVAAYLFTRLAGLEEWDLTGLATQVIELAGLGAIALGTAASNSKDSPARRPNVAHG
jgi:hypothetical protein